MIGADVRPDWSPHVKKAAGLSRGRIRFLGNRAWPWRRIRQKLTRWEHWAARLCIIAKVGPCIHQAPPLRERGFRVYCSRHKLYAVLHGRAPSRWFHAQSSCVRRPSSGRFCGSPPAMSLPLTLLSIFNGDVCPSGFPAARLGNTKSPLRPFMRLSTASALFDSGTQCSVPLLTRSAAIVQIAQ
jgi:hypothetical protein